MSDKIITEQVFNIYSDSHQDQHWFQIEDEQVVGGGSGIRVSYMEPGAAHNKLGNYIDIVGSPEMIRAIGLAILDKATELLVRRTQLKFRIVSDEN